LLAGELLQLLPSTWLTTAPTRCHRCEAVKVNLATAASAPAHEVHLRLQSTLAAVSPLAAALARYEGPPPPTRAGRPRSALSLVAAKAVSPALASAGTTEEAARARAAAAPARSRVVRPARRRDDSTVERSCKRLSVGPAAEPDATSMGPLRRAAMREQSPPSVACREFRVHTNTVVPWLLKTLRRTERSRNRGARRTRGRR